MSEVGCIEGDGNGLLSYSGLELRASVLRDVNVAFDLNAGVVLGIVFAGVVKRDVLPVVR